MEGLSVQGSCSLIRNPFQNGRARVPLTPSSDPRNDSESNQYYRFWLVQPTRFDQMAVLGPNTLGTLVILLAVILLIVVLSSAPHQPSVYFLAARIQSQASRLNQPGIIKLGVFGYCILTEYGQNVCSQSSVGYALDPREMFGLSQLPAMINLSEGIIQTLTKALVLHVLATILASLSFISGLVSHIDEFSKTCWTSCFASLSASITLLVMIFDLIFFSIIRARLNTMSSETHTVDAVFGNAMWFTISAWLCLAFSGFFFCAGRCLCSFRRTRRNDHVRLESHPQKK